MFGLVRCARSSGMPCACSHCPKKRMDWAYNSPVRAERPSARRSRRSEAARPPKVVEPPKVVPRAPAIRRVSVVRETPHPALESACDALP